MNWNVDIKELTKRQWAWVATGIAVFCGLLYFLAVYKYTVTMAFLAAVAYFIGRGVLASKGQ